MGSKIIKKNKNNWLFTHVKYNWNKNTIRLGNTIYVLYIYLK